MKSRIIIALISILIIGCKNKDSKSIYNKETGNTHYFPQTSKELQKLYKEEFNSSDALNLYLKAHQQMNQEQFNESLKNLKKALKIEPSNKRINFNMGGVYSLIGKLDSAQHYYAKAINIDSTFDLAYNALGITMMNKANFRLADEYFTKAIELDSTSAAYYLNKGLNFCYELPTRDSCCKYIYKAKYHETKLLESSIKEAKLKYNCRDTVQKVRITIQSFKLNRKSINLDKKNKATLSNGQDSIFSKKLIKITDKFYDDVFEIYDELLKLSGGFKYYKDEGYYTDELVAPFDKKSVEVLMKNEGQEKVLSKIIKNYQTEITYLLYTDNSMKTKLSKKEFIKKYNQLEKYSDKFEGLTVSSTLLKLSKLVYAEKKLIQEIIKNQINNEKADNIR